VKPSVAFFIADRAIAHVVGDAVDFKTGPRGRAVEVENVAPDRMLVADLHPARPPAQLTPEEAFGQRELAPEFARFLDITRDALAGQLPLHHSLRERSPSPFALRENGEELSR
jgi:hypothetical protein